METTMSTEIGNRQVTSTATVRRIHQLYQLVIRSDAGGSMSVIDQREFPTRDSLEMYMEANTSFRLGDFVRRL